MIKKEQSWDLMITLNKEDYPVIVKAKPEGGFKVHYISFIVIFYVLAGSLAFVDWVHNFAHVFLWLAVAILEFLWLYCTVGELSILSGELSELQENAQASSEAVRDRHLALASPIVCGSHLTSHDSPKRRAGSQAMALQALDAICAKRCSGMCHGWTSKPQKTLNRGFRIAITGYTYGAALLCCVFLCH